MSSLTLIGTYRVRVSDEELRFIAEEVCGSMEKAQEEVGGLALVEIEVRDATEDFDVGLLHQDGSDQVAYDERYFSADGNELAGDGSTRPDRSDFRVCFFLHHFDPTKRILSPYGDLVPDGIAQIPERLSRVCVYGHPG